MSSSGRAARLLPPFIASVTASLLVPTAVAHARRLPPKPPCLAGEGEPRFVELTGEPLPQLRLCTTAPGSEQVSCYAMDLASGQLQRRAAGGAPVEKWKLEVGEEDVKICTAAGASCKTVRASGEVDPGLGLTAQLSQDGSKLALAYLSDETTVEVFEVATGKKLAELHGRAKNAMCIYGSFAGESILVAERDCGGDALSALWLASPDGKRLADAGGAKSFATSLEPAHVSGDDWAFASARGDAIAIQDVKTGKVKKKISLGKKGPRAVLAANGQQLVAAFEGKRLGEIAVIELANGYKVRKLSARCGK